MDSVTIITNLYLAGFLQAFGITPLNPTNGTLFIPDPALGSFDVLGQTFLCQTGAAPDCAGGAPSLVPCVSLAPGESQWPDTVSELKEWQVLFDYLTNPAALNGSLPPSPSDYDDPITPRVIDVTP